MNPVSIRLLSQQLICQQFATPHDVVAHMGAMQAQDYLAMRWAVAMRTRKPSEKVFERDFNEGRIIRTHLFRNTWQLVAAEDYRWMVDICSDKARAGIRGWARSNGILIPEDEEFSFREFLSNQLQGKGSLTRDEIVAITKESGSVADMARIKYLMILAEVSGVLCSGTLTPRDRTYMLAAGRVPCQQVKSREESLAELARRYFSSHAPATLEDFVWWTGLNIGDCRKGIEAIRNELFEEQWKGVSFYIHGDCRTRGFRSDAVHLLPAYDEYLIGYKSRHVALHPDHRHHAHDQTGTFWPVILLGGEVVGNWTAAKDKVVTNIFKEGISLNEEGLDAEITRYQNFLMR